ncbi:MAG: 2-C-methyl-D-erythritol 2,4-cyclodiphosphate synthase [bacterium]
MRVGIGYDVHKLVLDKELIIGGVNIPYEKGLLGHSDADVLVHAIIDSLLGATKKGDIGKLFPDNDESFKNISSIILLEKVYNILKEENYVVINIDSTIIAQAPKMRPFIEQMEENIAKSLNISQEQINIKATTEEGLGFTGALEGISANAVCLVQKIK